MRVLVADDERPARDELKYLINDANPEIEVETVSSGVEVVEILSKDQNFDGIFLDINLGDMSGLSVAMVAHKIMPGLPIIFATAYDQHAIKAFELGAADYILKPFDADRIRESIKRIEVLSSTHKNDRQYGQGGYEDEGRDPTLTTANANNKLTVSHGKGVSVVDIDSITYIETMNRGCMVHTAGGEEMMEMSTLTSFEQRLIGKSFFKVHKSYLVNLSRLKDVTPGVGGNYYITLKGTKGEKLPVGRSGLKVLRQIYGF